MKKYTILAGSVKRSPIGPAINDALLTSLLQVHGDNGRAIIRALLDRMTGPPTAERLEHIVPLSELFRLAGVE